MTYGEVTPQIFHSKETTSLVAWSINFRSHRHVAAQGNIGAVKSTVTRNKNAVAVAQGTTGMQSVPTGFNYLMLYVPVEYVSRTRILRDGFETTDIVGLPPSWHGGIFGR